MDSEINSEVNKQLQCDKIENSSNETNLPNSENPIKVLLEENESKSTVESDQQVLNCDESATSASEVKDTQESNYIDNKTNDMEPSKESVTVNSAQSSGSSMEVQSSELDYCDKLKETTENQTETNLLNNSEICEVEGEEDKPIVENTYFTGDSEVSNKFDNTKNDFKGNIDETVNMDETTFPVSKPSGDDRKVGAKENDDPDTNINESDKDMLEDVSSQFSKDLQNEDYDKFQDDVSNMDTSLEEKDKVIDNKVDKDDEIEEHRENPVFVQVDPETEKDVDDNDKDNIKIVETDPIASDIFDINEDRESVDEECIIPDSQREMTQEEKDAAATITPLRDISSNETNDSATDAEKLIIVSKYEEDALQVCNVCLLQRKVKYKFGSDSDDLFLCDDNCLSQFKEKQGGKIHMSWEDGGLRVKDFTGQLLDRLCASCNKVTSDVENNLSWELMDFCNATCLTNYQKAHCSTCSTCKIAVRIHCLGKYCVRFGNDTRQFCTSMCLEEYKKGLKVCSYCQQDMSEEALGFVAPVGDKGQFKDFCSQICMEKYDIMTNDRPPKVEPGTKCSVCQEQNRITIEFELDKKYYFCGEPCFVAFGFVNNVSSGKCAMCKRFYIKDVLEKHQMYYDNVLYSFCSNSCQNIYIIAHRKIVPCSWCKVKKYNFDMIRRYSKASPQINMCSVNCFNLYQHSIKGQYSKKQLAIVSSKRSRKPIKEPSLEVPQIPIITNVQSLATNGTPLPISTRSRSKGVATTPVSVKVKHHFVSRPTPIPEQRNCGTMCKVRTANKGTFLKPVMVNKEVQTDEREAEKILIPVPVPIYVPTPMHMFTAPVPMPVPFPLPIPVPIFIPTTRNSAAGIMKEIKKIQVKMPTDPYEAELLMMAEMVAGEKKEDPTDSESDVDDTAGGDDGTFSPEPVDASNAFGDDMLQMALKMATELDEPAVDLEGALTANTITAPQGGEQQTDESVDDPQPMHHMLERQSLRGRKRGMRQPKSGAKRGRRVSHHSDMPIMQQQAQPPPPPEPTEKPDANMCLKYTFGVNAWKQWVTTKNTELEKSSRMKLFKTEILQLTADELNYSLCLFVKEVRKPNGAEYAPDTIYYLCLGIQQYLFENGRIDNIFCDSYYEKFTDCLDEVAKKFSVLYNDSHYIVTRVEEEHLWESKQLGAHSPHVLLSTLMFFNTKHFNLTTVDEHMQLSFSHIMKHWKRNPNQPGASKVPGARNVLLRFYPPQSAIQNNARKKKVYEQQENEENPLRCPVKLYEFYLSKCPDSVKTRNDVFYLQPERSCVPDSPVWYSTMPLPREALEKMLHRVKMVKEINVALLTS